MLAARWSTERRSQAEGGTAGGGEEKRVGRGETKARERGEGNHIEARQWETWFQEEERRQLQEERERKEHEEYLQLKESFVVEEEGLDVKDDETEVTSCVLVATSQLIGQWCFTGKGHHRLHQLHKGKSGVFLITPCVQQGAMSWGCNFVLYSI